MLVKFQVSRVFNNELEIDDIGQTAIRCSNSDWGTWYLMIKTIRGVSHILEYGPVFPDTEEFGKDFSAAYYSLKFNEKRLHSVVSGFLNDSDKIIEEASECDPDELFDDFPDVIKLYKNIN